MIKKIILILILVMIITIYESIFNIEINKYIKLIYLILNYFYMFLIFDLVDDIYEKFETKKMKKDVEKIVINNMPVIKQNPNSKIEP
jgi:hypothetical protein